MPGFALINWQILFIVHVVVLSDDHQDLIIELYVLINRQYNSCPIGLDIAGTLVISKYIDDGRKRIRSAPYMVPGVDKCLLLWPIR